MPSKHPRIALTADDELASTLERVRAVTGSREPDATLVRRLAMSGAEAQLAALDGHREATAELFGALQDGGLELGPVEIDALNRVT